MQGIGKGQPQRIWFSEIRNVYVQITLPVELVQQALQHDRPIGAGGCCTDEVHEDEITGLAPAKLSNPCSQQGRLTRTGLAQDHEGRAVPRGVPIKLVEVALPADVYAGTTARKRFMLGGFAVNGSGSAPCGKRWLMTAVRSARTRAPKVCGSA